MKHALVIGGTGMLAQTVLWLAKNQYHVSIVGRDEVKMNRLVSQSPASFSPLLVDYTNDELFKSMMMENQQTFGSYDLVVAWIHSNGRRVLPIFFTTLSRPVRVVHVLSHRANRSSIRDSFLIPAHVTYHQVQLGHVVENGEARWLTHTEISNGVIKAIQSNKKEVEVGIIKR